MPLLPPLNESSVLLKATFNGSSDSVKGGVYMVYLHYLYNITLSRRTTTDDRA